MLPKKCKTLSEASFKISITNCFQEQCLFYVSFSLKIKFQHVRNAVISVFLRIYYIIPGMPPIPDMSGIPAPAGSGISATTASVVKNRAATDAAF